MKKDAAHQTDHLLIGDATDVAYHIQFASRAIGIVEDAILLLMETLTVGVGRVQLTE